MFKPTADERFQSIHPLSHGGGKKRRWKAFVNESEVADLVAEQLLGRVHDSHGWSFKSILVQPPERAVFAATNGMAWPLWVVLREANEGYVIGYDDSDGTFQLVVGGVVISESKTLMDAIDGM